MLAFPLSQVKSDLLFLLPVFFEHFEFPRPICHHGNRRVFRLCRRVPVVFGNFVPATETSIWVYPPAVPAPDPISELHASPFRSASLAGSGSPGSHRQFEYPGMSRSPSSQSSPQVVHVPDLGGSLM